MAVATKRPNVTSMIRRFPKLIERYNRRWEALVEEHRSLQEFAADIQAALNEAGTVTGNGSGTNTPRVGRPPKATTSGATTSGTA